MMTTEAQHFQALEKENHKHINKCNSKCLLTGIMYMLWNEFVDGKCSKQDIPIDRILTEHTTYNKLLCYCYNN